MTEQDIKNALAEMWSSGGQPESIWVFEKICVDGMEIEPGFYSLEEDKSSDD